MSEQPIPGTRSACGTWSGPLRGPLFGLAPDGVFRASALTLGAVGSYPAFSPLPAVLAKRRRFKFLWHCPLAGLTALPPACIPSCVLASATTGYAASRPLVFGLSSLPNCSRRAILRPSKIGIRINRIKAFIKEPHSLTELLMPSSLSAPFCGTDACIYAAPLERVACKTQSEISPATLSGGPWFRLRSAHCARPPQR